MYTRKKTTQIIVHCSATPEGRDYTIDTIRKWHTSPPNNWEDIGYHYVIYRDGTIHVGRKENLVGAHCVGHNSYSIGICYIGGCASDGKTSKDTRTVEQKEALKKLIKSLKKKYPAATVHGHNEFSAKDCPCFNAREEYKEL